jgi:hypothetical protein
VGTFKKQAPAIQLWFHRAPIDSLKKMQHLFAGYFDAAFDLSLPAAESNASRIQSDFAAISALVVILLASSFLV